VAHEYADSNGRHTLVSEAVPSLGSLLRLVYWRTRTPWPGYGLPFNGQTHRAAVIEALIRDFRPEILIETGTLFGHTTRRLADFGPPVYSVEVHPGFHRLARLMLRGVRNASVIRGDSAATLERLQRHTGHQRVFAYLDAHWYGRLPLAEEVALILESWSDVVIVIDDCRVPHDPGYGYDIYDGVPVAVGLLDLPPGILRAYPAVAAVEETGGRRGAAYLAQGSRGGEAVQRCIERGELRAAEPAPA
jgi:hypothetical protein